MKDSKQKKDNKAKRSGGLVVHDWQPMFAAVKDVIDWALDIAVKLSRDYEEDIEAIEKVRVCFHAWLAGRPCEMEVTDLLLTLATILSAIEIDLGIESVDAARAAARAGHRTVYAAARPALPGATRDEHSTVVIRKFPGRRNASAAFTQLAA